MHEHALEHDLVARISVIRDNNGHFAGVIVSYHPRIYGWVGSVDRRYQLRAEFMEVLECTIRRLGDAVDRQQAESAMKWQRREVTLLEEITECPEAVDIRQSAAVEESLDDECSCIWLVVEGKTRIGRGVSLGVIERFSSRASPYILYLLPENSALCLRELRLRIKYAPVEWIVRIMMSAHEVSRHFIPVAEIEEFFDPLVFGCLGTTDWQFRVDIL